jgi:hypothetical protein
MDPAEGAASLWLSLRGLLPRLCALGVFGSAAPPCEALDALFHSRDQIERGLADALAPLTQLLASADFAPRFAQLHSWFQEILPRVRAEPRADFAPYAERFEAFQASLGLCAATLLGRDPDSAFALLTFSFGLVRTPPAEIAGLPGAVAAMADAMADLQDWVSARQMLSELCGLLAELLSPEGRG